jgi:hypothetical protein
MLREPHSGEPRPGARLVVLLVALAVFGGSGAVALFPAVRWVLDLL